MRLRPRAPVARRRSRRPSPSAAGRSLVTRARLTGVVLMAAAVVAIGWLVSNDDFALGEGSLEMTGLRYTDSLTARSTIGLPTGSGPNLFLLRTHEMQRALAALPAVAVAEVRAVLPNRVLVSLVERTPVLLLTHGDAAFLVDGDGVVLQRQAPDAPQISDLPTIDDRRQELAVAVEVGQRIDSIDTSVMLQLGAITPEMLESSASELALSVDDADGYVISVLPTGWRAVFGHYTPTLRPPDIIARQVQCLRSLLAAGESTIDTIYLAPLDERCGTYLPRPTPRVTPSPVPST